MHKFQITDYGISPTLSASGTIVGASNELPGAPFTMTIPNFDSEFYDVIEGEESITYTLKDQTYGTYSYVIVKTAPEDPVEEPDDEDPVIEEGDASRPLWPYIVGTIVVLLLACGATVIVLKIRKDKHEKDD